MLRDGKVPAEDADDTDEEQAANSDNGGEAKKKYSYLVTSKDKLFDKIDKIQEFDKYMEYHKEILELIPEDSCQVVDVKQYSKIMQQLYEAKYILGVHKDDPQNQE